MSRLVAQRFARRSIVRGTLAPKTTRRPLGLGDDAPPMSEEDWRKAMLAQQSAMTSWQERWVKRDELQRWIQIGATLMIPLSAAIWKAIFRASRRSE